MNFMPQNMEQNNTSSQFQLETLEQLFGNLTGLNKWVAQKILNSGFVEGVKKTLNRTDRNEISNALKKLTDMTVQQAAKALGRKVATILTIIVSVFASLAAIVMLAIGGSIVIPIVAFVILVGIIWFVTGQMSKLIASKASGMIFKAIEGRLIQLSEINRIGKE